MKTINTKITFIITLVSLLLLFIFSNVLRLYAIAPKVSISKEDSSYTINSELLKYFSFGQHRLISSYLWTYTMLESDIEHFNVDNQFSWMYQRFNTISELDPSFIENYRIGGIYLSIIKDDTNGALSLLNKGIKIFPHDIDLNFYLGFSYYFDLVDSKKALPYFDTVINSPSGLIKYPYIYAIVARARAGNNNLDSALAIIEQLERNAKTLSLKERYRHIIYSIKAEIDLNCLNIHKVNCNLRDYFGNLYFKKAGEYVAKLKWTKYREKK